MGELLGMEQMLRQQQEVADEEPLVDDDDREFVGDYEGGDYADEEYGSEQAEHDALVQEEEGEEEVTIGEVVGDLGGEGVEEGEDEEGLGDEDDDEVDEELDEETDEAAGASDEWTTLRSLPVPTQQAFVELLGQLKGEGRTTLNVMLLGKGGVGKSSTVNSLFNMRMANVAAFQTDPSPPQLFARTAAGFSLRVLDTPSLIAGDAINTAALESIAEAVQALGSVDVVVYVDRLDCYCVDPLDKELLEAITVTLGRGVWANALIGLTRAGGVPKQGAGTYDEFCNQRGTALREAIRKCGAPSSAPLPLVLIENSSACATDAAGQKVLPDGRPWLPLMVSEVTEAALASRKPFTYSARQAAAANPNNRRKWLIPLVLLAQVLLKVFVLDRLLEEDRITGDQYGPYDPEFVAEERDRLAAAKEEAAAAKRRKARKAAAAAEAPAADDDSSSSSSDDEE